MAATSLSLLKGKKNDAPAPEPEVAEANAKKGGVTVTKKKEPEPAPADEASQVADVDKMSSAELDKLVADNDVEVPTDWSSMKVGDKRKWLKEQFEEVPGTTEDNSTPEEQAAVLGDDEGEQDEPEVETQASKELDTGKSVSVAKAKAPTKASSAKAAKTLHGEVLGPDMIENVVHTIENLKEEDAKGLVRDLSETAELTYFKLGGVLSSIQSHGWFAPYSSFKEFVEGEHGIPYRKAMYWIDIYNKLSEKKVPWEKVKALGWTKLKEIVSVLTADNVDEWVGIASGQTTLQLIETVKNKNAQGQQASSESEPSSSTVTTKTFKVHDDQKKTIEAAIAKSKEVSGTAVDTVALENICLDYLGGAPKTAPAPDMKAVMKAAGWEKVLEAFGELFPAISLDVSVPDE